jgi:2,3-bisphosphoglycerate-independent phosphoglycerate mutase
MNPKKILLIIMDGWAKGLGDKTDGVSMANPQFVNNLYKQYPNSELITHSEAVGLPNGQMGNSEVGHLNIGAGRIIYQDLLKIDIAIRENKLAENQNLLNAIHHAKQNNCTLHLMGLVSNGGVHSSLNHLKALCSIALKHDVKNVCIHAFTDGRDTDPKSGLGYLTEINNFIANTPIKIGSIIGRYYAMDRDTRWERIKLAYDLLVNGIGSEAASVADAINSSYNNNVTDEFILPVKIANDYTSIKDNDVVICFNFRTDRCREITQVLTQFDLHEQNMHTLNLHYTTLTKYDETYKNVHVIFENNNVKNPLGEVLAANGKTQIRIAETEKYPHVTFFFNGGREAPFEGEQRIMIPSPKVATYDLKPEMSAIEMKEAILPEIKKGLVDFVCLNFANADMVGHTGDFNAVVMAVQTVDACVKEVVEAGLENGYTILLTADHGNADYMINPDGSPNTAHTKNPVPLFLIDKNDKPELKNGKLADLAPTILTLMQVPIPSEMTGDILI